ncbi:MAG: DUF924 domain-containing protein [bacterium]|nr:DUF924 domain-containing protein [bacterium]
MPALVPETILDFWFSDRVRPLHFEKSEDFDKEIRDRFLSAHEEASKGLLTEWQQTAQGCLALVILLDQFPRNMFRGTPQSFASDRKAISVVNVAIGKRFDSSLPQEQCAFLYMPFMHSEDLGEQKFCVELYENLGVESNLQYAVAHLKIVERFGRFPHRNTILGRASTSDEIEFLKEDGSSF